MKAVYEWKAMLKDICKEKGWEEDKNCKIKYEANADIETDTLTFTAKIYTLNAMNGIILKKIK